MEERIQMDGDLRNAPSHSWQKDLPTLLRLNQEDYTTESEQQTCGLAFQVHRRRSDQRVSHAVRRQPRL